ncbi:MAG TPA: M48 family metallopeptidase [Longimicrobium sp.]|nr:M48 family metallopeptidase [Longimicrobium sp.]
MLRTLVVALALAIAPAPSFAQAAPTVDSAAAGATTGTPAQRPGGAVAQTAPATPAIAARASAADTGVVAVPQPTEKALRYFRGNLGLWVFGVFWGLLLPCIALFTGLSARIRDLSRRIGRKWYFTVVIYGVIISVLAWVVGLPLAYYTDFAREHAYGLSNQTFAKWFGDSLKALLVGLITIPLVLWIPYLLLRKSPRRWWLWTSLVMVPLLVLTIFITPIWIDPLFNRFGPMQDKQLETQILGLAQRAGIEGGRVFQVDKSVDTEAVNAYVTGFGGTKRIVLWDTIIRKLNDRELLFVMGHEMGHFVLRHVLLNLLLATGLILVALYSVHRLSGWFISRWKHRFGFDRLDDIASYPLLGLIITLVSLVITPIPLAFSRWAEHESDRFALELTRDNHHAATAFVKLQSENLGVPFHGTLYKLWHDSHPPLGERIEFANRYKPWAQGQPLKYGDRFAPAPGAQTAPPPVPPASPQPR